MLRTARLAAQSLRRAATAAAPDAAAPATVAMRALGLAPRGSLRVVQDAGAAPLVLDLVPGWFEDCTVGGVDAGRGMTLEVDRAANAVTLQIATMTPAVATRGGGGGGDGGGSAIVHFELPEQFDVDVDLQGRGDVHVGGTKLEGPARLRICAHRGDVSVGKVRSQDVELAAPEGSVTVRAVAEATRLMVHGGKGVAAKRLSGGASVVIEAGGGGGGKASGDGVAGGGSVVRVDALFSPAASITCVAPRSLPSTAAAGVAAAAKAGAGAGAGANDAALVHVDSLHGNLTVRALPALPPASPSAALAPVAAAPVHATTVSVQRITGSVDLGSVAPGGVEAHFDVPEGGSVLDAADGPVRLLVSHEAAARVRLRAEAAAAGGGAEATGAGRARVVEAAAWGGGRGGAGSSCFFPDSDSAADGGGGGGDAAAGGDGLLGDAAAPAALRRTCVDTCEELARVLTEAKQLLEEDLHWDHWVAALGEAEALLAAGQPLVAGAKPPGSGEATRADAGVAAGKRLLSMFGGMGSFNDIILQRPELSDYPDRRSRINHRFYQLQAKIHSLSTVLVSGEGGGAELRGVLVPAERGGGGGGGKIDLAGARRMGWSTSFFGGGGDAGGGGGGGGGGGEGPDSLPCELPMLVGVARGGWDATLESLSWRDSIKRKFGVK